MSDAVASDPAFDPNCELCRADRFTEWYYEDDRCWVAECESCSVPMVVWKRHDPDPPEEVRAELQSILSGIATSLMAEHWLDGNMRSIPTHFHVHARPRGGFWSRNEP